MANVVANDKIKVTWVVELGDQIGLTSLHCRMTNVAGTTSYDTVAQLISSLTHLEMKALICNESTFKGILVQRVFPKPVAVPVVWNANAGVGTGGANPLPRQVSGLLATRTDFGGRRFRGRMYIPFPSESMNDTPDAQPTQPYKDALAAFAAKLLPGFEDAVGPDTWRAQPVLIDQTTGGTTDIVTMIVRSRWATQRRRGDFGAKNVSPI